MTILLKSTRNNDLTNIGPLIIGPSENLVVDQVFLPTSIKWLLQIEDSTDDSLHTSEIISQGKLSSTTALHVRYGSFSDGIIDFSIETEISSGSPGLLRLRITNNETHDISASALRFQVF